MTKSALHIAIVDGDLSYPATSGKRLRTLNLMLALSERHHITYIARSRGDASEQRMAEEFLRDHKINPLIVPDPVARKQGPLFYGRLALNLASKLPYSVASHQSRVITDAVTRHAASYPADVWQFEWSPYVQSLPPRFDVPRVLVAHNVDSLLWRRYWSAERNPLKRLYIRQQWKKFERYERHIFTRVNRVVACSQEDANLIAGNLGMTCVDVVENGIDRQRYEHSSGRREPSNILFLGSLDWRPNIDALTVLCTEIFPKVIARQPQARLVVVGRQPSVNLVRWLRQFPFVELHADVPDTLPYLVSCGVLAVPLRIAGGTRLKILEAAAAGLPVVSSTIGAEGLELVPDRHLAIADAPDQFAAAIVRSIESPSSALAMSAAARQVALERYDWASLADKLERTWRHCVSRPIPAHQKQHSRKLQRT